MLLKVPAPGAMDCHWYVRPAPTAVTVKVAVCPTKTCTFCGCCVMIGGDGGFNVNVAVAVLPGSATLVALTVTVCWFAMTLGAVYRPVVEIEPKLGLMFQPTPVLL